MKHLLPIAIALLASSCTHEAVNHSARLTATCTDCTVQWEDGYGVTHMDTLLGEGLTVSHDIVIPEGRPLVLKACKLFPRMNHDLTTLSVVGDVNAECSSTATCVSL